MGAYGLACVRGERRTVDGNGDTLCQFVAVCTNKGRHVPQLIDLQILGIKGPFCAVCVNNLEVELVGLGYSSNGYGAWVALQETRSVC